MRALPAVALAALLAGSVACVGPGDGHDALDYPVGPRGGACKKDLEFAAAFLLDNDAGIQGLGWKTYPGHVVDALARERVSAAQARLPAACAQVLNRFMAAIRRGHLDAVPLVADDAAPAEPYVPPKVASRRLSARTAWIEVPSFGADIREQLIELIEANQDGIRDARNLIIDVRRNGGGNDYAFEPLLWLLGPATYRVLLPDVLVTPANIAGWESLAAEMSHPPEWITSLIARMKTAGAGWIPMSEQAVLETRYGKRETRARPERVAVLIGGGCASSCEQFALVARQNARVSLIGRRTFGAVDAGNLRKAVAPSGQVAIYYTTTFVRRPPGQRIDGIGIAPDTELPAPVDEEAYRAEVEFARRHVERPRASSTRPPAA